MLSRSRGFTIVELLIVIVVIGILAGITIVAYNGVQNRAKTSAAQSAVSQAAKKAAAHAVQNNDQYPATLALAGVSDSNNTSYQYSYDNAAKTYCITATTSNISYYQNNTTQTTPKEGGCPGHNQNGTLAIVNYVLNPGFETNTTYWTNAGSGVTGIARSTTQFHSGTASLQASASGTLANQGAFTNGQSHIEPNLTYTASAWVKGEAGKLFRIELGEVTSGGALVGGRASSASIAATGSWQRLSVSKSMGATADRADIVIRNSDAVAHVIYIDDVLLSEGSTLYNYADGSFPNWAWLGDPYASISQGIPQ